MNIRAYSRYIKASQGPSRERESSEILQVLEPKERGELRISSSFRACIQGK